jgi:ribosome-binding factor A
MRDPRLGGLTITRVEVSPDLHYAWIYVDLVSRPQEVAKALDALSGAGRFLRNEIRQSLRLRHTPELVFRSDKGLEHSERIHHLLDELRRQEDLAAESDAGGPDASEPS